MSLNTTNISKENQVDCKWCNDEAKQEEGNSQLASETD